MKKEKRLITAALTYVNNIPHVGHIVGCHLPADIFARYCRSAGYDTTFIGGSDMHGTPAMVTAAEHNMSVEDLTLKLHGIHDKIYKKLGISYDIYSNTHTPTHEQITKEFFLKLLDQGYIKTDEMEMFYCEEDKMFLPDRFVIGTCPRCGYENANGDQCEKCDSLFSLNELKDAHCKICGKPAVLRKSKHIFLNLSKDIDKLSKWIESKKDVWRPHVYSEAKRWVSEGLKDRCISRDIKWGFNIPLEGFEDKVFYVWFDAPIGYISITKELSEQKYQDLWVNKDAKIYNFVGKDNIQFHTIFFPTMQIENGDYNLAHNVVGLNFLNYEGQKVSKSKGVGVFFGALVDDQQDNIDIDTMRAYLTTVIPETRDTDFKWDSFRDNTNAELVGKLGNLFNRTLNMIQKNFQGELNFELDDSVVLDENDKELLEKIKTAPQDIADSFEKAELREAYKKIMTYASVGNLYLEKTAPWQLIKQERMDEVRKVLYLCLNLCASLAIVASPIMPNKMRQIWTEQIGLVGDPSANDMWQKASQLLIKKSHACNKPQPLFERLDDEKLDAIKKIFSVPYEF